MTREQCNDTGAVQRNDTSPAQGHTPESCIRFTPHSLKRALPRGGPLHRGLVLGICCTGDLLCRGSAVQAALAGALL